MEIVVVGINHESAGVDIRERLTIESPKNLNMMQDLIDGQTLSESVVLSTCNRTEIYSAGPKASEQADRIKAALLNISKLEEKVLSPRLYVYSQEQTADHLFRVVSGLDSMVLGETEITGQVKDAFFLAQEKGFTGKILNNMFQRSFKVAKHVRTQTSLGQGKVSVASVAVDLACKLYEDLKGRQAMVLGTGQMAQQVLKVMLDKGAKAFVVSSSESGRAQQVATDHGCAALELGDYESWIGLVDILIASTRVSKALIDSAKVRRWMNVRKNKPFFIIDIGMPRNVDSQCGQIDNVYLYNLDDLNQVSQANKKHRESQIKGSLELVQAQTRHFMSWVHKEFYGKSIESADV